VAQAAKYYYLYLPYIAYLIYPVAALLATLFTVGGLTVTNELVAIKVSGVSFSRVLSLLLLTTSIGAFGTYVLGETLIPSANRQREDLYRYEIKRMPRENRAKHGRIYVQVGKNRQLYINRYKPQTREAIGIQLIERDKGRVIRRVDAEKMIWLDNEWYFQGAQERIFSDSSHVVWNWNVEEKISGRGLHPEEFERVKTKPEELNREELLEFIQRIRNSGGKTLKWETEAFSKVAQPVAAVIIVLFGAPMASIRRRGGTALGFGLSLFICFVYFGIIQIGKVFGYNGTIDPWLGAWIGNIFFGIVGFYLILKTVK
jgi:lipopolysaccharide export system permease protein